MNRDSFSWGAISSGSARDTSYKKLEELIVRDGVDNEEARGA